MPTPFEIANAHRVLIAAGQHPGFVAPSPGTVTPPTPAYAQMTSAQQQALFQQVWTGVRLSMGGNVYGYSAAPVAPTPLSAATRAALNTLLGGVRLTPLASFDPKPNFTSWLADPSAVAPTASLSGAAQLQALRGNSPELCVWVSVTPVLVLTVSPCSDPPVGAVLYQSSNYRGSYL